MLIHRVEQANTGAAFQTLGSNFLIILNRYRSHPHASIYY